MKFGKILKTFQSKKGNAIVFRYPKKSDLDNMLSFVNNLIEEDTFVEISGIKLTREEEIKHLEETVKDIEKGRKIHVVAEVNGKYAGNGVLRIGTLRHSHVAEIGISLVPPFRDEGIGTALMQTLINEAKTAGLRLLTLNCFENNDRALHVYRNLGFIKVGVIPGEVAFKGTYLGEIKMYLSLV